MTMVRLANGVCGPHLLTCLCILCRHTAQGPSPLLAAAEVAGPAGAAVAKTALMAGQPTPKGVWHHLFHK